MPRVCFQCDKWTSFPTFSAAPFAFTSRIGVVIRYGLQRRAGPDPRRSLRFGPTVRAPVADLSSRKGNCQRAARVESCCAAPHRCYFFVRPLGGSSIRFCSSFSACSASISNSFCSCLKLPFMARSLVPAALSAHLRASCRRCSARVVMTGRTLVAVGHRGGRRKNAGPLQPAPGSNAKPLPWLHASPAAARTHKGIPCVS
jgi:hypothetical protein